MIKPGDLKVNKFYFHLYYLTDKTKVPEIRTYFYLGKNLYEKESENKEEYYFQESESYQRLGSALIKKNFSKSKIILLPNEKSLFSWYDLQGLLEKLQSFEK